MEWTPRAVVLTPTKKLAREPDPIEYSYGLRQHALVAKGASVVEQTLKEWRGEGAQKTSRIERIALFVAVIAALLSLVQTSIMADALTRGDRNRSIEAINSDLLDVCEFLDIESVPSTSETYVSKEGFIFSQRVYDPFDIVTAFNEGRAFDAEASKAIVKRYNRSLKNVIMYFPDVDYQEMFSVNEKFRIEFGSLLINLGSGQSSFDELWIFNQFKRLSSSCYNIHSLLINALAKRKIHNIADIVDVKIRPPLSIDWCADQLRRAEYSEEHPGVFDYDLEACPSRLDDM